MATAKDIARTANVHWEGDVARGKGTIEAESGLVKANYSFGTRFASEPGTNPEELLAASHAACFTMALSAALTRAGHPPQAIDTQAIVHLVQEGAGFTISRIDLTTTARVEGIDANTFATLAGEAKAGCPISKALAAVEITMTATLNP